jgi:GNAT superfamily N-acetyltransferase
MDATMTLTQAGKADGPAVFELLWAARDEIPLSPTFCSDQNMEWISWHCDEGRVWVVKENDTIVGAALLDGDQLSYLVVSASHRRKGIGRSLLREAKCEGLWAKVNPANAPMIQFLEGEGFQHDPDRLTPSGWNAYRLQS